LRAGIYHYDVDDYCFNGYSFGGSAEEAIGQISYTKNSKTRPKDLEFKFKMFIVSLKEAKEMHPELDIENEPGDTSWSAAYFYNPN